MNGPNFEIDDKEFNFWQTLIMSRGRLEQVGGGKAYNTSGIVTIWRE